MATKGKAQKAVDVAADKAATLTKTDAEGNRRFKCQYCGKWIKAESFEEFMAGDYCHTLRDERGFTTESLAELRASMSADEVPESEDGRPYVKVAVLGMIVRKEGIPVSRLVKAFGKDRCIDGAMHPKFQPVYVGRARYVHPDCGEEWGLNFMRNSVSGRSSNNSSGEQKEVEAALS